jgi:hypothetical protein
VQAVWSGITSPLIWCTVFAVMFHVTLIVPAERWDEEK